MSGFVYFIGNVDRSHYVKIGWCRHSPFARLKELQTGCPEHLTVFTYFPGSLEDERRLHRTFDLLRYRGEWFINDLKLRDFIDYLTEFDDKLEEECSRERFEEAVWDVLVSGYDYPHRDNLELYKRSADKREWKSLFPDEADAFE
jgi:hypothetical protein